METQIYFDFKNNKLSLKGVNAGYKLLEHNEFTDVDGTFISEWRKATDADPTFDDVLKEANSIGEKEISEMSDNGRRYSENTPKKYAETLWGYINDILEKEKEEEMEI